MVRSKQLEEIIGSLVECKRENKTSTGIFTILRGNDNLKNEIEKETNFLDRYYQTLDLSQRLYHLREDLHNIEVCLICKENPKAFHRLKTGYFPTCGSQYCKKKAKSNSFKKTIKEKYKGNYFSEGGEVRDRYKKTMLERYGVDHNFKSEIIRSAIKETMLRKYGSESPLSNPEILDKRNSTCLEKHGTINFIQSEKTKSTNLLLYGHTNPMKNPEISNKVSETSSKTKRSHLESKLDQFGAL